MAENKRKSKGLNMAIVAFDIKDLEDMGYTAKKLEDIGPKMGIEIEEISEKEVKINVTPNRPDLLDFTGFLRALDNFTGENKPKEKHYSIKTEPVLSIKVMPEVKKVRPYIAGLVAQNLDLRGNKLKYLINFTNKFADTYGRKRRKIGMGVHRLSRIKGDLVYDAASEGTMTPLESKSKMKFSDIIKKNEKGQEYGYMFSGKKPLYPFISDSEKTLVLVPIVQCEESKTTEDTKDVFVEITGTSKKAVAEAANIVACAFIDLGAEVFPVTIEYPTGGAEITPLLNYKEIKVKLADADRTIGAPMGERDIIGLANKMGYVASQYGKSVLVYIPPYRVDVLNEQDIIEDIAISFGYDRITPIPVYGTANGLASEMAEDENKIATMMVGLGYMEAINSLLTNEKVNFENMSCKYDKSMYITLADSKTTNLSMIRTDLLPGLMQNLAGSMNERMPQRLFEIGRVFNMNGEKLVESVRLAFASEHSKANFAEAKSVVESFARFNGISNFKIKEQKNSAYIEGRCASLEVNGISVGVFGELHPRTILGFGLDEPVVGGEITVVKEIKYEV